MSYPQASITAQQSHYYHPMQYIFILMSIIMFALGYLLGRKYVVVKRDNVPLGVEDVIDDVKRAVIATEARVISPGKVRAEKQFSKDFSEDIL